MQDIRYILFLLQHNKHVYPMDNPLHVGILNIQNVLRLLHRNMHLDLKELRFHVQILIL